MKRFLRFLGIVLMGVTAAVTLLGGVGTTCVALNPTNYDSMRAIADYQWLYILYVLIGIALGILGIRATIKLVRSQENAEKNALFTLAAGLVIGGIHIITSRLLRGSSMPVDGVVYITALTLFVFLIFQIPKIKQIGLYKGISRGDASMTGGMTAVIISGLVLSVQFWVGSTHSFQGLNYADAFHDALLITGSGILISGITIMIMAKRNGSRRISTRYQVDQKY